MSVKESMRWKGFSLSAALDEPAVHKENNRKNAVTSDKWVKSKRRENILKFPSVSNDNFRQLERLIAFSALVKSFCGYFVRS
jgi:hypothetical protein